MVEALTIALAIGISRGGRSSLLAVGSFWAAEGLGVPWLANDGVLLALLVLVRGSDLELCGARGALRGEQALGRIDRRI